jgi:FixJ family two-component response regulator
MMAVQTRAAHKPMVSLHTAEHCPSVAGVFLDPKGEFISHDLPTATMRIGLVDDDVSVRRAVARMIRAYGYSCLIYESGESALADPEILHMDCLIVDIQLGGINGFELRDRLRALGFPIPHVFITAHMESDSAQWSARVGKSVVLTKPFEEHQLIASIESSITGQSE